MFEGGDFVYTNGAYGLIDKLVQQEMHNITMEVSVTEIEHNEDGAKVTFSNGETKEVDAVLVTVPVGVL